MNKIHSGKQKLFITGISGFIGSEIARKAIERGYKVAGLIRQSQRSNEAIKELRGKVDLYEGDLRDYWTLRNILKSANPDYVLHLGAITPVSYSFTHPYEVTQVNYVGTINLVEACKDELPQLKKFLFSSSMEVYGYQDKKKPFVETTPPHPACPYAVAKLAAEKYLQYSYYAYKFPCVMFRQTNCYGRKENDYFVVEAIVTKMLKNPKEINLGRKEPIRNFIFIDDLVDLWFNVIESDNPKLLGEVFNTGPNNGLSIYELANKIAKKINWNGKINWNTRELRPGEIFYLNSKNNKIKKIIGWQPEISLDKGLDWVIDYWRNKLNINKYEIKYIYYTSSK